MSERDELRAIVEMAHAAGADESTVKGEGGLTADVERVDEGSARMVRVWREGAEVFRVLTVEAGDDPPAFYPHDLPFSSRLPCTVVWRPDTGLAATWSLAPPPGVRDEMMGRLAALRHEMTEEFEELVERWEGDSLEETVEAVKELRASLPQAFLDEARASFGDLFGGELSGPAAALVSDVLAFHEEAGWSVAAGTEAGAPFRSWRLERGGRGRRLTATTAMGKTTIMLHETAGGRVTAA